jgi:hypothetical protein
MTQSFLLRLRRSVTYESISLRLSDLVAFIYAIYAGYNCVISCVRCRG